MKTEFSCSEKLKRFRSGRRPTALINNWPKWNNEIQVISVVAKEGKERWPFLIEFERQVSEKNVKKQTG